MLFVKIFYVKKKKKKNYVNKWNDKDEIDDVDGIFLITDGSTTESAI